MKSFDKAVVAAVAGLLLGVQAYCAEKPVPWTYEGFTVDTASYGAAGIPETMKSALIEQFDMVRVVGLPPEILAFIQGVKIRTEPENRVGGRQPALYAKEDRAVRVCDRLLRFAHHPVLLHEMMHAFHDQRIPGGFRNTDIAQFYERAKGKGAYAPNSHMMENRLEFFACSATVYLYGVTGQEPFNRAKVMQAQPTFYGYLQALFGANAGKFSGSLMAAPAVEATASVAAP